MQRAFTLPAAFFAFIPGLVGMGNCWRAASRLWQLPGWIGEVIMAIAAIVWLALMIGYIGKWIWARPLALAEFRHPIQCCFISLVPLSVMLIAIAALPYAREAAIVLFTIGAAGQLGFGVHRTGTLWMGGRDPADTTPVAYLPTVAGGFVMTIVAAALGEMDIARLMFGAGVFSWVALESVILRRVLESPTLPVPLRPTMGIHFAPPVVGCVAYLSITSGTPDLLAQAMFGYGLFQGLVLIRLIPWLRAQAFAPSYWAYTFATTACSFAAIRFVERGLDGVFLWIAPVVFVVANLLIGMLTVRTVWLLLIGRLLPPAPAPIVKLAA